MARPVIIVDESKVVELASKAYRMKEIAAIVRVSESTLRRRFDEAYKTGRQLMRGALRAKQFEVATGERVKADGAVEYSKPNPIMLIWLGKQELQQADKREISGEIKRTTVMVVGIHQNKLNALTQGYHKTLELAETTSDSSSAFSQKAIDVSHNENASSPNLRINADTQAKNSGQSAEVVESK